MVWQLLQVLSVSAFVKNQDNSYLSKETSSSSDVNEFISILLFEKNAQRLVK